MIPESHSKSMHTYDTIEAIKRMAYKRLDKGTSKESVIEHLNNLAEGTWKNSGNIRTFIYELIIEIQEESI